VPPAIRQTLFDPFVSCGKENGTGLGLTVVQKIIQDHGGDVGVECTSDQGTAFKVMLPLLPLPNQAASRPLHENISTAVKSDLS
jgi:nitrogen-specific signal transduction histidine kinase